MISAQYRRAMLIANAILVGSVPVHAQSTTTSWRSASNPDAIAKLSSGEKTEANAGWWGFNAEDSTDAIQSAIDSGARKVVVPFVGKPWIVRPLKLRSNMEFVLEPGVLLLAKRGEFRGKGDSLLSIVDAEDVTVRGPGATIRMWKSDYQNPPYDKAEWRMGLRILGARNVLVEGVRIESSGGDGIYISGTGNLAWSEDVTIRNVVCDDHHRQGISVISAENLLIENCVLSNTRGTAPESGIDFEPNEPHQRLKNCVVRNSQFFDNAGHQILVYLKPLDKTTEDVSIRFENCHVREGDVGLPPAYASQAAEFGGAGMCVGAVKDDGPQGIISFVDCTSENTGKAGARIYDCSKESARIEFIRCTWANPWRDAKAEPEDEHAAVQFHTKRAALTTKSGGVHFEECAVIDDLGRPVASFSEAEGENGLFDVTGRIYYRGPGAPALALGDKKENVTLEAVPAEQVWGRGCRVYQRDERKKYSSVLCYCDVFPAHAGTQ